MKFRVRCNETNEIYDVEDCWVDGRGNVMDCNGDMFGDGEVTIELFTGQEDRNGVEIYEGDDVRNSYGFTGKVIRHEHIHAYAIKTSDTSLHYFDGQDCEVIQ